MSNWFDETTAPDVYSGGVLVFPRRKALDISGATVVDNPTTQRTELTFTPGEGEGETSNDAVKDPVYVLATTAITLSGAQVVDGVSVPGGKRVFAAAQVGGVNSGIYISNLSGAWARAGDWAAGATIKSGCSCKVVAGTEAGSEVVVTTADVITVGTTPVAFSVRQNLVGAVINDVPTWNGTRFVMAQPTAGTARAAALITTSIAQSGTLTYDGVALIAGDVVLDIGNATPALRGRWTIAAGAWTRTTSPTAAPGEVVTITGGTSFMRGTSWQMDAALPFTLGTTAQTWRAVDGSAYDTTSASSSTATATRRTIGLPRSKNITLEITVEGRTAAAIARSRYELACTTDAAGAVTLGIAGANYLWPVFEDSSLGTVNFTASTDALNVQTTPASATATAWHVYYRILAMY